MSEQEVHVVTRLQTHSGSIEAMAGVMARLHANGHKAAGNSRFEVLQGAQDPSVFVVLEIWRNVEAADAHMSSDYVAAALQALGPLLSAPPSIERFAATV